MAGKEPHRIGTLVDMMSTHADADFLEGLRMAFEDALADGILDRPIEILHVQEEALPRRPVKPILDAWMRLADAGCLAIIGPWVTENTLSVRPLAERHGVPTIVWSGTNLFPGNYCFNLGNGSIPDEAIVMANHLFREGVKRVAMVRERNQNGEEYRSYFQQYADLCGLEIVRDIALHQVDEDPRSTVERMRAADADSIAYFGFGLPALRMNPIFAELGWDPPRIMCGAFMFIYAGAEFRRALEGWTGIDQLSEENPRLAPFLERYAARTGRREPSLIPGLSYDTGMVVAHAIRFAPVRNPEGVKAGLERVRMLPTTTGGPRTHVTFGPFDHKGWKGDYLVVRKVENGRSVFKSYYEPWDRRHSPVPR
jgi:ABC-type branched-subunit amino acid transport system substrate-binding protein